MNWDFLVSQYLGPYLTACDKQFLSLSSSCFCSSGCPSFPQSEDTPGLNPVALVGSSVEGLLARTSFHPRVVSAPVLTLGITPHCQTGMD